MITIFFMCKRKCGKMQIMMTSAACGHFTSFTLFHFLTFLFLLLYSVCFNSLKMSMPYFFLSLMVYMQLFFKLKYHLCGEKCTYSESLGQGFSQGEHTMQTVPKPEQNQHPEASSCSFPGTIPSRGQPSS